MNLLSEMTNEEFRLFNPAYCGYLLYSTITEYQLSSNKALPCSLVYLILPMIMTKYIADSFPRDIRTSFISWSNDNQHCISDFDSRVADYFEVTQSAVDFLVEFKVISISEFGGISIAISDITRNPSFFKQSPSMISHLSRAKFLGKWFSNYPPATVYSFLGIKP